MFTNDRQRAIELLIATVIVLVLAFAVNALAEEPTPDLRQELANGSVSSMLRNGTGSVSVRESLPIGVQRDASSGRVMDDARFGGAIFVLVGAAGVLFGTLSGMIDDPGDLTPFVVPIAAGAALIAASEPIAHRKISREGEKR